MPMRLNFVPRTLHAHGEMTFIMEVPGKDKGTYSRKGIIPIDIHPDRVAIGQLSPIAGLGQR